MIAMEVLALSGSALMSKGNTNIILDEFITGLRESGADVEQVNVFERDIKPCHGKLSCWLKTPGKCWQKDDMAELLPKLASADVWVLASPVYWYGISGPMKNLLDRMIPLIYPQLELREGHCRYSLNEGVKSGKLVLISSCAFWELDTFEPMMNQIMSISKCVQREFAGALLRPHGALFKYMLKTDESLKDILVAAKTAGHELVEDGKISQDSMVGVSGVMMMRDKYIDMINQNFERLRAKKED